MGSAREIRPQPGPQTDFLASPADIVVYGGSAGGGKSWGLLLDPLRHVSTNAAFNAVIFRRNSTQVRNPGGLWDESMPLYSPLGAVPIQQTLEHRFPGGGRVRFAHLEHEGTKYDWQGAQIPCLSFDELTHFSEATFFYLLSRNRSMCGVRPYVRATCNPDADHWLVVGPEGWGSGFISWWIDPATGYPIQERAGVLRWFIRVNDRLVWADSAEALVAEYGEDASPKSVTFIPAKLSDNQALMKADPGYLANLKALDAVERERLLGGNWKIRAAAGLLFQRAWCEVVDAVPAGLEIVRYWDLAATEKIPSNDPDHTVGIKLGRDGKTGLFYLLHCVSMQVSPAKVEAALANTASADGTQVRLGLPQDPGQAGKSQAQYFARQLAGYSVSTRPERGDKVTRFGPFSAQAEAGNVKVLRGPWNGELFDALEGFPDAAHDDHADACAGAFGMFVDNSLGLLDYYRRLADEKAAKDKEAKA